MANQIGHVRQMQVLVPTTAGQSLAVGRESHGPHARATLAERGELFAGRHLPEAYQTRIGRTGDRGQPRGVRGKGESDDIAAVAFEWSARLPGLRVPEKDAPVHPA